MLHLCLGFAISVVMVRMMVATVTAGPMILTVTLLDKNYLTVRLEKFVRETQHASVKTMTVFDQESYRIVFLRLGDSGR